MATESLDVLDEFFDFAQLENDNGMHGYGDQHEFDIQDFAAQPLLVDMEWQPTAPAHGILTALPSDLYSDIMLQPPTDLMSVDAHSHSGPTMESRSQTLVDDNILDVSSAPNRSPDVQMLPCFAENDTLARNSTPSAQPQRSASVIHKPASAKRKGPSTRIPSEARQMLEEEFAANPYPCSWEIDIIAHQANLDVKRVRNWYNNTRARKKNTGEYCGCW
jgi:hypothetical protein